MAPEPGIKTKDHYASFNRRMWAITFDSILFYILILPLLPILRAIYPVAVQPVDFITFQQDLAALGTPGERLSFFWRVFYESGHVVRLVVDTGVQSVLFCLFSAICWRIWSSSPGKMLMRMRIVDANTEERISNQQIILRLAGYLLSTLCLLVGFFWISFDKRRQGWHDRLAGTTVIIETRA